MSLVHKNVTVVFFNVSGTLAILLCYSLLQIVFTWNSEM